MVLLPAATLLYLRMGVLADVVGLAAALVITLVPSWTNKGLAVLGTLSYAVYLLHVPVGGRVINFAVRLQPSAVVGFGGVAVAAIVTFGAAWLLYRFVEAPAKRYASSVRFAVVALIGPATPVLVAQDRSLT